MDCEKHPIDFDGYSPKEFAEKFVRTNYFYQEKCFREMILEYQREAEGDRNRNSLKDSSKNRTQLADGLEKVVEAISGPVLGGFRKICLACKII